MKLMPMMGGFLLMSAIGVQAHGSNDQAVGAATSQASRTALDAIFKAKPGPAFERLLADPRADAVPECSRYHTQATCEATNWCVWDGTECIDGIPPAANVQ